MSATQINVKEVSLSKLVSFYNEHAEALGKKQIKKFTDRAVAELRVSMMIEDLDAEAQLQAELDDQAEQQNHDDKVEHLADIKLEPVVEVKPVVKVTKAKKAKKETKVAAEDTAKYVLGKEYNPKEDGTKARYNMWITIVKHLSTNGAATIAQLKAAVKSASGELDGSFVAKHIHRGHLVAQETLQIVSE